MYAARDGYRKASMNPLTACRERHVLIRISFDGIACPIYSNWHSLWPLFITFVCLVLLEAPEGDKIETKNLGQFAERFSKTGGEALVCNSYISAGRC
jgi:hypothetical protein